MKKVVRSDNYSIELWFVVDEFGQTIKSFQCWQNAFDYANSLNCIGVKSTNGLEIESQDGTTSNGSYVDIIRNEAIYFGVINKELVEGRKYILRSAFNAGVSFAHRWINVNDKPYTPKRDKDGILYSDDLLLKVKGFDHYLTGYYVKANDDEFFDIYQEVSDVVNQEDITHYRYIDLK